jgi:hypothetical protein
MWERFKSNESMDFCCWKGKRQDVSGWQCLQLAKHGSKIAPNPEVNATVSLFLLFAFGERKKGGYDFLL